MAVQLNGQPFNADILKALGMLNIQNGICKITIWNTFSNIHKTIRQHLNHFLLFVVVDVFAVFLYPPTSTYLFHFRCRCVVDKTKTKPCMAKRREWKEIPEQSTQYIRGGSPRAGNFVHFPIERDDIFEMYFAEKIIFQHQNKNDPLFSLSTSLPILPTSYTEVSAL